MSSPTSLTEQQQAQEDQYEFPYHYLDLIDEEVRCFQYLLSRLSFDVLKKELSPFQGQLLLDIGCGDGRFCYELRHENVRLLGIDYSQRAIEFARVFNPKASFRVQSLGDLELEELADQAVMIETLEHIPPDKIPEALEHVRGVLKPGGKLIVTVPSKLLPQPRKHYQHFDEASLRATLQPHFEVQSIIGSPVARGEGGFGFYFRRRLAKLLFRKRKKWAIARRALDTYLTYCRQHMAVGDCDKCTGLIAICRKH